MAIGFKKCCCKACDCEKSWPGDNASLHAAWNVNKPIPGTSTANASYVARSSSCHLYPDYSYSVDNSVPYWWSELPFKQPEHPIHWSYDDLYVKKRIRFTHPDLPIWQHNIACISKWKNVLGTTDAWLGANGILGVWDSRNYYEHFLYANDITHQYAIKGKEEKCHGFSGRPNGAVTPVNEHNYHYVMRVGGSIGSGIGYGDPGGPIDDSGLRQSFVGTLSGFLFTNETFPSKHYHNPQTDTPNYWKSDQCNWDDAWGDCGFFRKATISNGGASLSSISCPDPGGWMFQHQAMYGVGKGYSPFPFVPPVGSSPPPPNWCTGGAPGTGLGGVYGDCPQPVQWHWNLDWRTGFGYSGEYSIYNDFVYQEYAKFSDGVWRLMVKVVPEDVIIGPVSLNTCHDGSDWTFRMKVWRWYDNYWSYGPPVVSLHTCKYNLEWVSV